MKISNVWHFTKYNYMIFGIGLLFIIIGYILMSAGETTSILSTKISPLILFLGYCVIIPVSIIMNFKKRGGSSTS